MSQDTAVNDNWNQHWAIYAKSAELNPAQAYRRELILKVLKKHPPETLLDAGSGQGDFVALASEQFPNTELLGIELSASGVDISRAKVPGVKFLVCDLLNSETASPEYSRWATHAVCSEVLEHLDKPEQALFNLKHFLRKEAKVIVTVPAGPRSAFDKHIGHRQHFTATSLRQLVESAGYSVETLHRAGFPFMNLYKCVVVLRGKKLIQDASESSSSMQRWPTRFLLRLFHFLFRFNLLDSPWGWQLVAVIKPKS
jgi:ubiquinone/menaquinone biosynthesis C-methylase UbiE